MKHRVVYTSDIHGNNVQYSKLVDYAIKNKVDSLIIGGDLLPKHGYDPVSEQKVYAEKTLPAHFEKLKSKSPQTQIFLMLGNDDFGMYAEALQKNKDIYKYIHKKRLKINKDFDIVGYSTVPITPFGIKDWEKYDLTRISPSLKQEYEERKRLNYNYVGVKSAPEKKHKTKKFIFLDEMEQTDSIQLELEDDLFTKNASKTLYVMHSPPNDTALDVKYDGLNVGSFAIKEFIQKYQPFITLHGHIHETVRKTGEFKQLIGKTLSMCSGNHNIGSDLALVVFDLYNPEEVQRLII